jgi:anaerobic ribonucleoside-triphosphate reductase
MSEQEKEIKLDDAERQECEIWTRVMGYFRPVEAFNVGKKSEYAERVCFSEKKAVAHVADMAAE